MSTLRTILKAMSALLCVAVVASGLTTGAAGATTSTPTAGLWALRYNDKAAVAANHQVGYVVLQEYMRDLIPQIRAASPGVKILVYKDVAATVSKACQNGVDQAHLPAGVGYCWADVNRPSWFLKDTLGQRIEFNDYPGLWYMDIGDPAYQDKWASNVEAVVTRDGWDGVMLDDVMTWSGHLGDRTIAKYPTWSAIEGAFESFLTRVGPRLMAAGTEVIPNIAVPWATTQYVDVYKRLLTHVSGSVREFSATWNDQDAFGGEWWSFVRKIHDHTVSVGKTFLAVDYIDADRPDVMTYARASFLMGVGTTKPGALMVVPSSSTTDPWHPAWTIDIGTPLGARVAVPGGAYKRSFTGGIAVANPTSASVTVDLGGTFTTPAGEAVTKVTLGPLGGAVLKGAATTVATTIAAPKLAAKTVSSSKVDLAWSAAAGANRFRVERSRDAGATWASVAELSGTTLKYRATGLASGTTYAFRVVATYAPASTAVSNTATATTSLLLRKA